MVWGTYAKKSEVQMGICFCKGGCKDALWHLYNVKTMLSQICSSCLNKVPRNSHLGEERAGAQSLFGICPNRPRISFNGASCTHIVVNCLESQLRTFYCQIDQCARIGEGGRGVHANLGNARILGASVTETPN